MRRDEFAPWLAAETETRYDTMISYRQESELSLPSSFTMR